MSLLLIPQKRICKSGWAKGTGNPRWAERPEKHHSCKLLLVSGPIISIWVHWKPLMGRWSRVLSVPSEINKTGRGVVKIRPHIHLAQFVLHIVSFVCSTVSLSSLHQNRNWSDHHFFKNLSHDTWTQVPVPAPSWPTWLLLRRLAYDYFIVCFWLLRLWTC